MIVPVRSPTNPRAVRGATRLSVGVFICGAIVALLASIGGIWPARAGIVIGLLAGLVALISARAHARRARYRNSERLVQISREQRDYVSQLRTHHRDVLESLSRANVEAGESVDALNHRVGELCGELSRMRGDQVALTARLSDRENLVVRLRAQLAEATSAAVDLDTAAGRRRADGSTELFSDDDHPTVVDLRLRADLQPEFQARRRA